MARELKHKVVVITGGGSGIGFEIADNFLKNKAKCIIILDISEEIGTEAVKILTSKYGENKAVFYKCDVVKDVETISKKLIDKFKKVDVLVNNAGVIDEISLRRTIEINTIALIEWTMKFWEHMRTDKNGNGGTILNMASIYGFQIDPFLPFYQASKHAVIGFTKSFGHESNYKRYGVRIVAICPGYTRTKLGGDLPMVDLALREEFLKYTEIVNWQMPDVVGKAAMEVFEKADSGTAWKIEGGGPIEKVYDYNDIKLMGSK